LAEGVDSSKFRRGFSRRERCLSNRILNRGRRRS
jgi:hypothetical protein